MRSLVALSLALGLIASAQAQRLVVAGGALTEIVYALDAQDQLVAVDSTSNWPEEARQLPRIGYLRDLPVEGIVALQPDHLLVAESAGPPRALSRLESFMPVTRVTDAMTREAVLERIHRVATLVDRLEAGEVLAADIAGQLDDIQSRLPMDTSPRTLVLLAGRGHGLMIGGRDTHAQALLDLLGLENAADTQGYKPLNTEAVLAMQPGLVVIATTSAEALDPDALSFLQATPAGREGRILVEDSMLLLGFGPRLPKALRAVLETIDGSGEERWSMR